MSAFFLNSLLWPFLFLAALPILLHLLSLRRLPTIDLSTYRFLFDTYVQQRRRVKLLEYLLLFLRVLFLLLLVLAIMRPRLSEWAGLFGLGGREVFILMDASASMQQRSAGVASLDRAKEAAAAVLEKLPPADRVTLIRLAGRAEVVAGGFLASSKELRDAVANVKPSVESASVYAAVTSVLSDGKSRGPRVFYLFGDLQKSGWKQFEDQTGSILPTGDRMIVVNVGAKTKPENRAVLGDAPSGVDAIVGQPVELRPRVANFGDQPADLALRVEIGGELVERFPLRLSAGKTAARRSYFVPKRAGPMQGRFALEKDGFDLDDEFRFTLNVARQVRVLLVNGKPDNDPFRDELLFLRAALSTRYSDAAEASVFGFRTLDSASLALEEVRDGEWDASRLTGADVVVLANAQQLSDDHASALKTFVRQGGGLLIFPGDRVHDRYQRLFAARRGGETALMPIQFREAVGDANKRDRWERLAAVDFGHPVFTIFRPSEGKEYLTAPRFFRRHRLELVGDDRGAATLARFSSQEPALVEGRYGKGIVVTAAFPASGEWSTLPLSGADFVPMMLRLVSYVRRKPELVGPSATAPGTPVEFAIAERLQEPSLTLTHPSGAPERMKVVAGAGEWTAVVERTEDAGYYRAELAAVDPAPVRQDDENRKLGDDRRFRAEAGFAVNAAESESDFAAIDAAEVRRMLGDDATVVDLSAATGEIAEELVGKGEIWRYLMYLLAAVFTGEFFLATLRGPKTAAEAAADKEKGGLLTRLTGVKQME